MAKYNLWKVSGDLISFLLGLVTVITVGATYVKWVLWAGTGWLW